MRQETDRWFRQAEEDLETARMLFQGKRYYAASYFAQQAAEKALKAFLFIHQGKPPRRIHDLRELGGQAEVPTDWLTSLTELSGVYLVSRCPDLTPGSLPVDAINYEESRGHLDLAERVSKWAKQQSQTR